MKIIDDPAASLIGPTKMVRNESSSIARFANGIRASDWFNQNSWSVVSLIAHFFDARLPFSRWCIPFSSCEDALILSQCPENIAMTSNFAVPAYIALGNPAAGWCRRCVNRLDEVPDHTRVPGVGPKCAYCSSLN